MSEEFKIIASFSVIILSVIGGLAFYTLNDIRKFEKRREKFNKKYPEGHPIYSTEWPSNALWPQTLPNNYTSITVTSHYPESINESENEQNISQADLQLLAQKAQLLAESENTLKKDPVKLKTRFDLLKGPRE
jgi:hypothetical protein